METIIDLTASEGSHELLTSTEVDTRLRSGTLLADRSLESYLGPDEEPRYVLRNKKSGVEFEDDTGTTAIQPDDGYQALALVTDVRVLFVVGRASGNKTSEVGLSEIVQAKQTDSGFRTTALVIETIDGRTWSFPCRGDTSEVASVVDELAQDWATAERLADEAEEQVGTAREHVDAGEYDAAAESLDGVEEKLETAVERLCDVGDGACAHIRDRAESLGRQVFDLEGPIYGHTAGAAHATAQDAWREQDYETAAAAYDRAIDRYERAIERYERTIQREGTAGGPDEPASDRDRTAGDPERALERLGERLAGAVREREILRVAPLADADTARRRARALDDPEAATELWEDVLAGYRELLALTWDGDGEFVVETAAIREQASAAASDAIHDFYEAGRRQLGYGDRFAVDGRTERAMALYERARDQFEQARRIARDAEPDRVDELDAAIETVRSRLDGVLPTDLPDDDLSATGVDTDAAPERSTGRMHATAGKSDATGEEGTPSVIGRIQSQKRGGTTDGRTSATAESTGGSSGEMVTNTELRSRLRDLDSTAFTQLVADLWEAQGWSTTVFSATNQVVYDVVAMREEPEEQRLLLWTEHRPDGSQLGPRAVKRCATARDSSQGADSATIVTNSLLRTAAQQRAEELDVTVIDGPDLVDLLRFEGFLDRLDEETAKT